MSRLPATFLAVVLGAAVILLAVPGTASAHPLGNFTVSLYSGLRVGQEQLEVDYVIDMAEIPAFQERREIDRDADGDVDAVEGTRYAEHTCESLAEGLRVSFDGDTLPLRSAGSAIRFPPGAGGLATLRLECLFVAETPPVLASHVVQYQDGNFRHRPGWHEITAVGVGVRADADVPSVSTSSRLTAYPDGELRSPVDRRSATVRVQPGRPDEAGVGVGETRTPSESPFDRLTRSYTDLVARQNVTAPFLAAALALAMLLGAIHAMAPGHGKTFMAACLVAERGSLRQAVTIGLTVAVTHTAGVLVLGGVLAASGAFAPEHLYPWLSAASGLLVIGVGVNLARRWLRNPRSHDHPRAHPHPHAHPHPRPRPHAHGHPHPHPHPHRHPHPHGEQHGLSRRSLLTMGFAGGMVPTPSALVVLLGAIALGRLWLGVVLVAAYGIGMAATLVAAGLVLVRARRLLERLWHRRRGRPLLSRAIPLVAAIAVIGSGAAVVVRSAVGVV